MRAALGLILAVVLAAPSATLGLFGATTSSPANSLASGRSPWFSGNGAGTAICAGGNASLVCAFGSQAGVVRVTATVALTNKAVASTYTVSVVDGTGPAGISTIVTASFASNGAASVNLAAGAADTIALVLKTKGGTPAGTYTGTLVIGDTLSGQSAAIPITVTH